MKRVLWPGAWLYGGVAQLGERLLCKQEVIGSIPFTSTILVAPLAALLLGREAPAYKCFVRDPPGSRVMAL